MNCRDRVLASLAGEEVYPVPYDLFCNGIYPNLQAALCRHYGIEPVDHEALMRAIGAHTRWGCPPYIGPAPEEMMFDDGSGTPAKIYKGHWGTWQMETYFEGFERPLRGVESVKEVEDYAWPSPDWFDYGKTHVGPTYAEWAEQEKDYLRVAGCWWEPIFSRVMDLYGMETGLMNMLMRPDLIHATVAKIEEFETQFFTRLARAAKGHADFLRFGDDFASQRDMLLRPELWREFFLPTWKRLFAIAHNHGFKTIMHSCGAVRPILGRLDRCGAGRVRDGAGNSGGHGCLGIEARIWQGPDVLWRGRNPGRPVAGQRGRRAPRGAPPGHDHGQGGKVYPHQRAHDDGRHSGGKRRGDV